MSHIQGSAVLFLFLTIFLLQGCQSDPEIVDNRPVVIRIPSEPDNLHPMYSRSSYATPIEQLIYLPLGEFDPQSLELQPLLVETLTEPDTISDGPMAGGLVFRYRMRDEATWSNGKPVTAEDYLFTLKAAFTSHTQANVWKSYLSYISDVQVDPSDAKKFSVYALEPYMLADQVVVNFNIFPAHVFDPDGTLASFSLDALRNMEEVPLAPEKDSLLAQWARGFRDVEAFRDSLVGSGPYTLEFWHTGESIRLKRRDNWWGNALKNGPEQLNAYPASIEYRIIPDETTAINALKEGSIDLISEVSASKFVELQQDPVYGEEFQFFTPALMQYNYLELNNRIPELEDPRVRKALAHVIDYKTMIDNLAMGLARRTIGPFHPDQPYYNTSIEPAAFDLAKARTLLREAGWEDTNKDGTVDKMIGGKRQELVLDILVTQKEEGQNVALLIKRNAEQAGIGINIETTDGTRLHQDLRTRNFEVVPVRRSSYPGYNDPYQSWHSASDNPEGNNRSGYEDAEADSLITLIRETVDPEERKAYYLAFQEELQEDMPVIFLYVPLEKIIASKRLEIESSPRRPGYFVNLFRTVSGQK